MTLRPYALVIDGRLEPGLEVELDDLGEVTAIQPLNGTSDDYVLSTAFVNSHSHFEYRGLEGAISARGYFDWIRAITEAKKGQSREQIHQDCLVAGLENVRTGVAYVAEHSDRPFSGEALSENGLDGVIFQEVITFAESESPEEKLSLVTENLKENSRHFDGEVHINPHAPWTVDETTLKSIADLGGRVSIHVAESIHENDYLERDEGPIARMCHGSGVVRTLGRRSVAYLGSLGYLRPGVQFVHCCDVDGEEIRLMAASGVAVAHCPRSNEALDCPRAPIREMLDAGVLIGLGMDSAASSGPIDMFAEMRAALHVAERRGSEVTPEEVWRMATSMGAESLDIHGWDVAVGSLAPLIKLHVSGAEHVGDLISAGAPRIVEWVIPTVRN